MEYVIKAGHYQDGAYTFEEDEVALTLHL